MGAGLYPARWTQRLEALPNTIRHALHQAGVSRDRPSAEYFGELWGDGTAACPAAVDISLAPPSIWLCDAVASAEWAQAATACGVDVACLTGLGEMSLDMAAVLSLVFPEVGRARLGDQVGGAQSSGLPSAAVLG